MTLTAQAQTCHPDQSGPAFSVATPFGAPGHVAEGSWLVAPASCRLLGSPPVAAALRRRLGFSLSHRCPKILEGAPPSPCARISRPGCFCGEGGLLRSNATTPLLSHARDVNKPVILRSAPSARRRISTTPLALTSRAPLQCFISAILFFQKLSSLPLPRRTACL